MMVPTVTRLLLLIQITFLGKVGLPAPFSSESMYAV